MAISVTCTSLSRTAAGFEATGTVADRPFTASTIKWAGDLIFKIVEADEDGKLVLKSLADSEFTRGERIAVARFLKAERIKFEATEVLSVEELSKLKTKDLRSMAKARGISGYYAKGVTKADLVAMLAPAPVADAVEVDAEPEAEIEIKVSDVAEEATVVEA